MPYLSFDLREPKQTLKLPDRIRFRELSVIEISSDNNNIPADIHSVLVQMNDFSVSEHIDTTRGIATKYLASYHNYADSSFNFDKRSGEAPCYETQDGREYSFLDIRLLKPTGEAITDIEFNKSVINFKLFYTI